MTTFGDPYNKADNHQPYEHKKSRFHGTMTNLDWARLVEKRDNRKGIPLSPVIDRDEVRG